MSSTTKRKLFYKNLPKLVRRKLFVKDTTTNDVVKIVNTLSRPIIVLYIFYRPVHMQNDNLEITFQLTTRDSSRFSPYFVYDDFDISITNSDSSSDYIPSIYGYMEREFGIVRCNIASVNNVSQYSLEGNQFILFDIQLNQLHDHIPNQYESRAYYKYEELENGDSVPSIEPTYVYHKNKWVWKETIYLHGISPPPSSHGHPELSIEFFDESTFKTRIITL